MNKQIYLDNAATSFPKAPGVGRAMAAYIDEIGANIGRGSYAAAEEAGQRVWAVRQSLARLFNFPGSPRQVVFTPGATYGLNQILRGYLRPGDHVVVSSLEHNAVMRPLRELEAAGVELSLLPADRQGLSDIAALPALLRPQTRLMLVNHASNVCGAVFPLEAAAALCRERGVALAVDACQSAGHYPLDFAGLGLSALALSGHKGLLGPQGVGALLLEADIAQQLRPLVSGGTGSSSDREVQPDFLPDRLESGTLNLPGIIGLGAAVEYVRQQVVAALREHELALTQTLLAGLDALPLRVIGPRDPRLRVGVVALDLAPLDNAEAAARLEAEFGLACRCGLHCSPRAHMTLGTFPQGTLRLSLGYANTPADVQAALTALSAVLS